MVAGGTWAGVFMGSATQKKAEKREFEIVAKNLGAVKLLPIQRDSKIYLTAEVKFGTIVTPSEKHKVGFGFREALLRVECPSYDIDDAYSATLPQADAVEVREDKHGYETAVHGGAQANIRVWNFISFGGGLGGKKHKANAVRNVAHAPYPLIAAVPRGWKIGSQLGDPRVPEDVGGSGLKHCLQGAYFSRHRAEGGLGDEIAGMGKALCSLRPKHGGNDPAVTATLYGQMTTLQVSVTFEPGSTQPAEQNETSERLKQAFVEILVERTRAMAGDEEGQLKGEVFLDRHAVHINRGPQPPSPPASSSAGDA